MEEDAVPSARHIDNRFCTRIRDNLHKMGDDAPKAEEGDDHTLPHHDSVRNMDLRNISEVHAENGVGMTPVLKDVLAVEPEHVTYTGCIERIPYLHWIDTLRTQLPGVADAELRDLRNSIDLLELPGHHRPDVRNCNIREPLQEPPLDTAGGIHGKIHACWQSRRRRPFLPRRGFDPLLIGRRRHLRVRSRMELT